jgi:transcription elongation factor Elf1
MKKTFTSECPFCGHEDENVSCFLGHYPAIAQLRGQYFNDCYQCVDFYITTIIKYINHTGRILEPEALDTSGVTYIAKPRPVRS